MNFVVGAEQTLAISGLGWLAALAIVLGAFLVTRKWPAWGPALVIAALPLYQVRGTLGIPVTLLELLLGAVVLALITLWPRFKPVRSPFDPWLALWVVGSLIASLLAPDPREAIGLWRAFFLEPALFFTAARAVYAKATPDPLVFGAAAAIGVTAVWTGALLVAGEALTYDDRLAGPFQYANFVALLTVPLILLLVAWPKSISGLLRYGAAGLGLLLLAGSQSRGGVIALGIGLLVLLLLRGGTAWVKRAAALGLVISALVLGIIVLAERNDEYSTRSVLWRTAGTIIAERPLLGAGPEHFQDEVRAVIGGDETLRQFVVPRAPDAHNIVLIAWTEWGLATLVGLLGLLVVLAREVWRRATPWAIPAGAMSAAIVVHGMIDTTIFKNDLALLLMLAMVLAVMPGASKRGPT